jgi:hypothetical protein
VLASDIVLVVVAVMTAVLLMAYVLARVIVAPKLRLPGEVPTQILHRGPCETVILLGSLDRRTAFDVRERFMSKPESLLYYLLKTAMPAHEVFPRMRLADVLEVNRGPQSFDSHRAFQKIADYFVDFVVCHKNMEIVAVIELDGKTPKGDTRTQKLDQFKQECIEAAGIRYYRFPPDDLPRYRDLRYLLDDAA